MKNVLLFILQNTYISRFEQMQWRIFINIRSLLDLHLYFLSVCSNQMKEIALQNSISEIEVTRERYIKDY